MYFEKDSADQPLDQEKLDAVDISELLFQFKDLEHVTNSHLKLILQQVPAPVLAQALSGTAESLQQKMLLNLDPYTKETVMQLMVISGNPDSEAIHKAQKEVLYWAHSLAFDGVVDLSPQAEP